MTDRSDDRSHQSPTGSTLRRSRGEVVGYALLTVVLSAMLLGSYHDRFWWPPDEGNYAHVAERVLDGEVLQAEIQDIHPGYVNFANAGAMGLFGRRLVSMRYPLVVLGVAQCILIFALLAPYGVAAAAAGSTAITALGFVQYLNPTAHWYALFLVILLAAVFHLIPRGWRWRLELIGAVVMTAVLFRQLSGVFIAMGATTVLLLESDGDAGVGSEPRAGAPWVARGIVAVMLLGLVGYLVRATATAGWVFFGIWPVLLLFWTGRTTASSNRVTRRMVLRLALGGLVAALPLVAYHVVHGSLGAWYQDTIVTATQFPRMPFFDLKNYATDLIEMWRRAMTRGPLVWINVIFWTLLTFVAAVVGSLVLKRLVESRAASPRPAPPALPIIAVFYAVVAVHYQIPIYLTYTVGLSIAALLWLTRGSRSVVVVSAVLSVFGLWYHAAQPLAVDAVDAAAGVRSQSTLARVGLHVEPSDSILYDSVIAVIHREVPAEAAIFAVPSHAELYFLADRRNPFRFFNTALGIRNEAELAAVLATLERDPPVLVLYNSSDKYNTPESRAIMQRVMATYEQLPSIAQFAIFRRPASRLPQGEPMTSQRH